MHFVEIRATGFTDLGILGDLFLWFYKDLLTRTIFYPRDHDNYINRLNETLGTDLRNVDEFAVDGTRVWAWLRKGDRPFVGWRDEVLTKRFSRYN